MAEPEDSLRVACDALLSGDLFTAMNYLTPEAITEAMSMGTGVATLPTLSGYSIDSQEQVGDERRYRVRFETNQGDVWARIAWREFDGAWKITSLSIEPR